MPVGVVVPLLGTLVTMAIPILVLSCDESSVPSQILEIRNPFFMWDMYTRVCVCVHMSIYFLYFPLNFSISPLSFSFSLSPSLSLSLSFSLSPSLSLPLSLSLSLPPSLSSPLPPSLSPSLSQSHPKESPTHPVSSEESSVPLSEIAVKKVVIVLMHPKLNVIVAVEILAVCWI